MDDTEKTREPKPAESQAAPEDAAKPQPAAVGERPKKSMRERFLQARQQQHEQQQQ